MGDIKPTMVNLDEDLWLEAKKQAMEQKISVKEWLAQAIKEKLNKPWSK
jgi:predicted HicB family RNase H-like nuclease